MSSRCPKCHQLLKSVLPDASGYVACSHCGARLRVKQPKAKVDQVAPVKSEDSSEEDEYRLAPVSSNEPTAASPAADRQVKRCPNCDAQMDASAVLCLSCGYHLLKRQRLDTARVESTPAEGDDHAAQTESPTTDGENSGERKIWGFNWAQVGSGGAMLLGSGLVALFAYLGGRIWFLPIAIAIIGFAIMINGLMGEDGVW